MFNWHGARTGAYFSTAPFLGAITAIIILGEPLTLRLLAAGTLMAAGVWLHLTEKHDHEHIREELEQVVAFYHLDRTPHLESLATLERG